jgi:hypothetical protein
MINYQGRLVNANGTPLANGDYDLTFRIYDAVTGGNLIWGPQIFDGTAGLGHGAKVPVVGGYFNVILGPKDTSDRPISGAFNQATRYLEITVGNNSPISPRQQILTAPFAFAAQTVPSLVTTGPLTLYVSTSGNDQNDGLAPDRAKRTIQAAVDCVPPIIRHQVSINVAPGVYEESIDYNGKQASGPLTGTPTIFGSGATPDDVIIRGNSALHYGIYVKKSNLQVFDLTIEKL